LVFKSAKQRRGFFASRGRPQGNATPEMVINQPQPKNFVVIVQRRFGRNQVTSFKTLENANKFADRKLLNPNVVSVESGSKSSLLSPVK